MIVYATRENGRSVLRMINRYGEVAQTLSDPAGGCVTLLGVLSLSRLA
ncbi:hypothetical protein [Rappaport israeli]|nr:hypothetical protein [Rappaport israeli]